MTGNGTPVRRSWLRPLACAAAAAFLICAPRAPAAGEAATPHKFIQSLADAVIAVIRKEAGRDAVRRETLRSIFLASFDSERIGRFVLGRYWRTINEEQRAEYMRIFPTYVADIYARQFNNYSGETFTALRSSPLADSRFLVNSEIATPKGAKIAVTFRIRRDGESYRVLDVAVEGASLIVTKRDEFASVVQRKGMDALLTHMRRQISTSASDTPSRIPPRSFAAAGYAGASRSIRAAASRRACETVTA